MSVMILERTCILRVVHLLQPPYAGLHGLHEETGALVICSGDGVVRIHAMYSDPGVHPHICPACWAVLLLGMLLISDIVEVNCWCQSIISAWVTVFLTEKEEVCVDRQPLTWTWP